MGDPFKRVRPGDSFRLSAEMHNRTVDSVAPRADVTGQQVADIPMNFRVVVKNATTGDLGIYSCLYITGPVVNPTGTVGGQIASLPVLRGVTPDKDSDHRICITLGPVDQDQYVAAAIDGVTPVKLNVIDEAHRFAKPQDGSASEMDTSHGGPVAILWKESGTGSGKWGLVRFGGDGDFFRVARFQGYWEVATTKTVQLVDEEGDPVSPTVEFNVVNFAATFSTNGQYRKLGACRYGSTWVLMWFQCN